MPLIREGAISEDEWTDIGDGEPVGEGPLIVPLDRWRENRALFARHNGPLGIRLKSDQPPAEIADDLGRFELVALEFPNFNDGRAYSYARILREQMGFTGELRAVGDVLQDQLFFMLRCGFDAFDVPEGRDVEAAIKAIGDYSVAYAPAADDMTPAYIARNRKT